MTKTKSLRELASLPVLYRTLEIELPSEKAVRAEGEAEQPAIYELAMSSETEVEHWWGIEILDHGRASVDLSRMKAGAAVLVDHYGDQVGVVESVRLDDDRIMRGGVRFSRNTRGQEVERDVQDRVRRHVSIGYRILKAKLVETREDGKDVWRITRWQPLEVSIVSVPADTTVGVGRSATASPEFPVEVDGVEVPAGAAGEEEANMLRNVKLDAGTGGGSAAPAVVETDGADKIEAQRADGIRAICKNEELPSHIAREFVGSTLTVDAVRERVAQWKATKGEPAPVVDQLDGLSDKERASYSYHKAIREYVLEHSNEGDGVEGLEREVHDKLVREFPGKYRGGLMIPTQTGKRSTLSSGVTGKGAELVQQTAGELIEVLRARTIALLAGARLLTGLTGPVGFPKVAAGGSVSWVAENPAADVADSDPTLGLALLEPKTMMGNIPFTRQLLMQSSFDVEGWTREELATYHGLALDRAFFHGLGSAGEPTGIYKTTGVFAKAFGSALPDLPGLMDMVVGIADKNADLGSMRFVTTPTMAGRLRCTQEFSGTNGATIWQGNLREGSVLGYNAMSSTQISKLMTGSESTGGTAHGVIFGNFADAFVALFGAMELVVDPYTKKKRGVVEITSFQLGDTMARHGESFAKGTAAIVP